MIGDETRGACSPTPLSQLPIVSAIGALVSADSVWANALGVVPNGFGYEEVKAAASPRPVDMMNTLPGNDADGLRLSRMRTIYMLKMGAKVSNRSVGRKDAHFRGFY